MSLLVLDTSTRSTCGPLHVEGTTFRQQDGTLFQWRGYSWFLGFLRYCRGEDVTRDLRWMQAFGFNIPRVFGPLPEFWPTPDYRFESFQWDKLHRFFDLLAAHGMYCNWSIGHYQHPALAEHVHRWYDIASQHSNVIAELVNEPHVGKEKPDPLTMLHGVKRRGVLTSYGLYGKYYDKAEGLDPVLDFGTVHIQRDSAWHRKARHAQELQDATGKPWISDEPAKVVEPGFSYPGAKNDPAKTPMELVWHAAVCDLWTPGFTYHCEEGKWGRTPTLGMLQHTCAETLRDQVFTKIDASWQTGEYNRGGNGDSPVDNAYTEENQMWTYTSLHDGKALSVRCGNIPLTAINGWRIVDSWANGTIARLTNA